MSAGPQPRRRLRRETSAQLSAAGPALTKARAALRESAHLTEVGGRSRPGQPGGSGWVSSPQPPLLGPGCTVPGVLPPSLPHALWSQRTNHSLFPGNSSSDTPTSSCPHCKGGKTKAQKVSEGLSGDLSRGCLVPGTGCTLHSPGAEPAGGQALLSPTPRPGHTESSGHGEGARAAAGTLHGWPSCSLLLCPDHMAPATLGASGRSQEPVALLQTCQSHTCRAPVSHSSGTSVGGLGLQAQSWMLDMGEGHCPAPGPCPSSPPR